MLTLTADQLRRMPLGLPASRRSGQATVTVEKQNDSTYVVTATCDSLARLVTILQEELTARNRESSIEEKPPYGLTKWQSFFIVLGWITTLVFIRRYAWKAIKKRLNNI